MNKDLKTLIFQGVALAMGIASLVLNIMGTIEIKNSISLLSIGLICLAMSQLENKKVN